MTRFQKLSFALTVTNVIILLILVLTHVRSLGAEQQGERVLRGRAIEIVDGNGVVRFSVTVEAASMEGGKTYPDRVLLRMASPGAGPGLKLVSSADGTDLGIMHNDRPYVRLSAKSNASFVKVVGADGKERVVAP